jgi:sugar/nucleoside kinase (ribokinase family)/class 3 adenylate cyclase
MRKLVRPTLRLAGIMFLDVKSFSTLTQTQLERFLDSVLPELAEVIDPYRSSLLELNTWGDAIVAVSADPVQIARLALDIRDYFRKTNFEAKGLPSVMQTRISLHAGTVKHGYDPIRRCDGVVGSNLNLAARIEPIITPGEVWSTHEFGEMLEPHAPAERLAFDTLGVRELARSYASRLLLRLRRSEEPRDLSELTRSLLEALGTRAQLRKAFDVIGIGALNTDYIATATSLKRLKPDLIAEHERHFEIGTERAASLEHVQSIIGQIGSSVLTASLGGSSFNTIHALARAVPELRLAYIGVAGHSSAQPGFLDTLQSLNVDTSCVRPAGGESGICVSYITRGERSMLTSPGVNTEMAEHLRKNKAQISVALGSARLVHVTSLFDSESPAILASLIRDAKYHNPWLQVSFDPGHDWVRRVKSADDSDPIRELMSLSSYLFLNQVEFELLASDLGIKDDQDLARDIFQHLSSQAVLILLKRYDEIRVFHRLHQRLKEIRFRNETLSPSKIEDATGAGDVFAAGLFIAIMMPGLELRDGIELGLRMVRCKLASAGSTQFTAFSRIVEDYVDSVYSQKIGTVGDGPK